LNQTGKEIAKSNYLLNKKLAKKILIIDLDVHQGNGTAQIFSNNKDVFTMSMHGKNNYPFHKEKSDLDIELNDGIDDNDYLNLLKKELHLAIENSQPDFVFYQCGVDILNTDKYGKLNISLNGCKQRDELVFNTCINNNLPIACAMGGGYSPKIADIVDAHCNTFKTAFEIFD
jgi:acetoin utilization deacetylase AcuC-like enzyme